MLAAQRVNAPESEITKLRKELNKLYDNFVKEYGYLNIVRTASFADDPDISFLLSLENTPSPKTPIRKRVMPQLRKAQRKVIFSLKHSCAGKES